MKSSHTFFALLIALCTFSPLHGAESEFVKEIEQMRTIYLKAVDGDKRDLRKAIKNIDKLSRKYPKHPLVTVYKGCVLAQRGRDIGERPLNRMRETEEGLIYIDRGLRSLKKYKLDYREAAEAQLLAAFTFVHIPDSVFHRLKEGTHLVKTLLAHDRFNDMPKGMQAGIYFAAAVVAEKYNDIEQQKHYLELSLKADPDGQNAAESRATLKKLAG